MFSQFQPFELAKLELGHSILFRRSEDLNNFGQNLFLSKKDSIANAYEFTLKLFIIVITMKYHGL